MGTVSSEILCRERLLKLSKPSFSSFKAFIKTSGDKCHIRIITACCPAGRKGRSTVYTVWKEQVSQQRNPKMVVMRMIVLIF